MMNGQSNPLLIEAAALLSAYHSISYTKKSLIFLLQMEIFSFCSAQSIISFSVSIFYIWV